MKVLQIGKFFPIRGGVEKVMYDLMEGLSAVGIECDMLCATTEDQPAGEVQLNKHAKLICVKTSIKVAATTLAPGMVIKLRRIAKQYDIIHVHHPDPMAALSLYLSGYKGKVVLHWHSDILKQKMLLRLYEPLQRWLIHRADLIVGTTPVYVEESPFLRQYLSKIDFIPIGVEPVLSNPDRVAEIRQRYLHRKIIFSLGRLVEYKGYEYLVRSAKHLPDDYIIVIGGIGPLKEELEQLVVSERVQHKVEFIGFVSDQDLPNYFQACDLFCLSSIMKTEAFAIVQIEAMSCSKPVVSTRIPGSGVSWVNEHGVSGLTVNIEDDVVISDAIKRIFDEKGLYSTLASGAVARYEEFFTRKSMILRSLALYEEVLEK